MPKNILLLSILFQTVWCTNLATLDPASFAGFYDILPALVWVTNDIGDVIFLNEQWCIYTGSTSFNWLDTLHPDDLAETIAKRQVSFNDGKMFETKYRLRNVNNEYEWFLTRANPIMDLSTNMITRWLGFSTSIHDKMMRLEREAFMQKEEEQRNSFIASIHHDCLTPLAGSIGLLELVAAQLQALIQPTLSHRRQHSIPNPVSMDVSNDLQGNNRRIVDIKKDISAALECNNALLILMENILDLSRLRAGKMSLDFQQFNIDSIVCETMSREAAKENIVYRSHIPPEFVMMGDPKRFRQIIYNLLANAIKFSYPDSINIDISANIVPEESRVKICVSDTGVGMSPDIVAKVFEAFVQGDDGTCRERGGSGLGLSLCRYLVEAMNGHIYIESQLEVGTIVCFYLPYKSRSASLTVPTFSRKSSDLSVNDQKVILIVEDDPVLTKIMQKTLSKYYKLLLVDDGYPAIEAFANNSDIELILMDCNLKKMDGFKATREIRNIEHQMKRSVIPIIAVTASSTEKDQQKCRASGMTDVISKPYRPVQLLERVRNILS